MARTTLMLDEQILKQLKTKAAQEGRTLQATINDLLRIALKAPTRKGFVLRLEGWRAELQPGVDLLDRDKLFDLMDGR